MENKKESSEDFYFDNSIIKTFAECVVRGIVEHKLKRCGKDTGIYGDLGTVGHGVMERFFQGKSIDYCLKHFNAMYDKLIPPGIILDNPMFAKDHIQKILKYWMELHPLEKLPFSPVEFEENVTIEMEPGYIFSMKRDMLVEDKQSGFYHSVDHKFRFGKMTPWWLNKFLTNSQISGYIWGSKEISAKKDYEVADEMILNIISLNVLPKLDRRCSTHKMKYSECSLLHTEFMFKSIQRTPEQIESWKRDILSLAKTARTYFDAFGDVKLIKYAPRTGSFSGGCTFCSMKNWCRSDFHPDLLDLETVEYDWRPWDELPF